MSQMIIDDVLWKGYAINLFPIIDGKAHGYTDFSNFKSRALERGACVVMISCIDHADPTVYAGFNPISDRKEHPACVAIMTDDGSIGWVWSFCLRHV